MQFKKLFEGPFSRTPVVDVEHLFHLLDKDDMGTLNLKEFVLGLALLNSDSQEQETKNEAMKLSFHVLEGDKNAGGIDMNDLTICLLTVYPEMGKEKVRMCKERSDYDYAETYIAANRLYHSS